MPLIIIASGGGAAPAAPPATDLYFSSVVLLTHMDVSPPIDTSNSAHTLTVESGPVLDTGVKKFGAGSFDFTSSTTGAVDTPNSGDFKFGDGDFTIEGFGRYTSVGTNSFINFDQPPTQRGWIMQTVSTTTFRFFFATTGGGGTSVDRTWAPVVDTWYHMAVSRSGADLQFFIDGTQLGATYNIGTTFLWSSSNAELRIGNREAGFDQHWPGHIDEVRITKGVGRYTANFTPPSAPFFDS